MPNTETKNIEMIRQYIESAYLSLQEARNLLDNIAGLTSQNEALKAARQSGAILAEADGSKIIEGVFDGQNMVGPDGKQYSVPANYASKSKLVEGDRLKLTIAPNGSFIYKQIGPVERRRLKGKLTRDVETGEFRVIAEDRSYKVLTASITYFKGEPQDEVVILIPRDKLSTWATVENIIHFDASSPSSSEGTVAAKEKEGDIADLVPEHELPAPAAQKEIMSPSDFSSKDDKHGADTVGAGFTSAPTAASYALRAEDLSPAPTPDAQPQPPSRYSPLVFDDEKDEFEEI